MITATSKWDIRTSAELIALFPKPKYRIFNSVEAHAVVDELSKIYGIEPPANVFFSKKSVLRAYGRYYPDTEEIAILHFAHCKSLFHEWYHHLDNVTDHRYDASDNKGGSSSLGWQFAERLWQAIREKRK